MELKFDVTGTQRKEMVSIISDTVHMKAVYKFMPTCAYVIQKKGDIKGLNIEVTPTTIQSDHQPFFVLLSLYGSTDCYIIVITPFFLVQKTYQRIKQFLNITI